MANDKDLKHFHRKVLRISSPRFRRMTAEIMQTGVVSNTHQPMSKKNPRRPVSRRQAQAIAADIILKEK